MRIASPGELPTFSWPMYMRCDEKMDNNRASMQLHTRSALNDKLAEMSSPSDVENHN